MAWQCQGGGSCISKLTSQTRCGQACVAAPDSPGAGVSGGGFGAAGGFGILATCNLQQQARLSMQHCATWRYNGKHKRTLQDTSCQGVQQPSHNACRVNYSIAVPLRQHCHEATLQTLPWQMHFLRMAPPQAVGAPPLIPP